MRLFFAHDGHGIILWPFLFASCPHLLPHFPPQAFGLAALRRSTAYAESRFPIRSLICSNATKSATTAYETNDVSETDPAHLSPDEIYNPEGVLPERPEAPKPASYYDVVDWLEELSEKPRDEDDEALFHRFMDSDDDTLIRRLAERLADIDLDGETLNALDDELRNDYYRERYYIISREAEQLLNDIDGDADDR